MVWNNEKTGPLSVSGFLDSLGRFGELFKESLVLAQYPRNIGSWDSPKEAELAWGLTEEDGFTADEAKAVCALRDEYVTKGLRSDDAQVVAYMQFDKGCPPEVCDEMVAKILEYTEPKASKYDGDKRPPSLSFLYCTQGVAY